jgi:hypothetical protein
MASEIAPASYVRAVREIILDDPLDDFLTDAAKIASDIFGIKRSRIVKRPVTMHRELEPDYMPTYDGIGVPNVDMFASNSLRVTLFERRAAASEQINEVLKTAYDRLTTTRVRSSRIRRTISGRRQETYRPNDLTVALNEAEAESGLTDSKLTVKAQAVADVTPACGPSRGTEYALSLHGDDLAEQLLKRQAHIIHDYARKFVASRPLLRDDLGFEPDRDPLHVSFMRVPNGSPADHELFIDALNENMPVSLQVQPLQWEQKIRSPRRQDA